MKIELERLHGQLDTIRSLQEEVSRLRNDIMVPLVKLWRAAGLDFPGPGEEITNAYFIESGLQIDTEKTTGVWDINTYRIPQGILDAEDQMVAAADYRDKATSQALAAARARTAAEIERLKKLL